jgi:hypothetical protein
MSSLLTIDWKEVERADLQSKEKGIQAQALLDEARERLTLTLQEES